MLKDILEVVNFLKDNSVTKAELEFELDKVRGEIVDHVDGFVGLHQHLEVEPAAMAHKTNRLENYI